MPENPENTVRTLSPRMLAKQAIFIFVAVLFFFSSIVSAYHNHSDLQTRAACAVCKSGQDLASGDTVNPVLPLEVIGEDLACSILHELLLVDAHCPAGHTRAPPSSFSRS